MESKFLRLFKRTVQPVDDRIPVVDQPQFDAIECNRCGECCEKFVLRGGNEGFWWNYRGPLGWLELWCYREVRGERMEFEGTGSDADNFAAMLFWGQLTPTWHEGGKDEDSEWEGWWSYSCGHFSRDADGLGRCGIYEQRPAMCANFPDGPVTTWDECSWRVELVDFEPVQGVRI